MNRSAQTAGLGEPSTRGELHATDRGDLRFVMAAAAMAALTSVPYPWRLPFTSFGSGPSSPSSPRFTGSGRVFHHRSFGRLLLVVRRSLQRIRFLDTSAGLRPFFWMLLVPHFALGQVCATLTLWTFVRAESEPYVLFVFSSGIGAQRS